MLFFAICSIGLTAQTNQISQNENGKQKKERLDFAKNYFELGGSFLPSFEGKVLIDDELSSFENSAAAIQYLNWGGFHFWGHGEFYVTIPLSYNPFQKNEEMGSKILHSVVTGARFYPWTYREKRITPYVGMNWSALDFKQEIKDEQPFLSKDFILAFDAGILYGYKSFSLRLGVNYLPNTKWDYPVSKTQKAEIKTPNFGIQLGLIYAMDLSKKTAPENIDAWNSFPTVSKQSLGAKTFGDFYVAIGPSLSFSLNKSEFNQSKFPYLDDQLTSSNFFEIAAGYNFNKAGLFTVFAFRNPKFETEGFGTNQSIKKTSVLFEINKFLIDYSGFTPFIGAGLSYDKIKYVESIDGISTEISMDGKVEPGFTFGWDIQPGKNQEALILRTNLRWYPFASFQVEGKKFNFNQLEYNLIQVIFYPDRLKKRKK